jgi:hypothetical protein
MEVDLVAVQAHVQARVRQVRFADQREQPLLGLRAREGGTALPLRHRGQPWPPPMSAGPLQQLGDVG